MTRENHTMTLIETVNNYVSSFSNEIEHSEYPIKFNASKYPNYQGMKVLIIHELYFKIIMALVSLTKNKRYTIMCKLFTDILCDGAQKWLNNVTPRTVTFFTQFAKLFITNYESNNPMKKDFHYLFLIT